MNFSGHFRYAESTGDAKACGELGQIYADREMIQDCIGNSALVQAFQNRDLSKCEMVGGIAPSQDNKDECYRYYASAYKEPAVCEKIVGDFYKTTCMELSAK